MKTFRFIGMAVLAILGSVNFIACSSDEDEEELIKNDDGVVTNQKKLMRVEMAYDYGGSSIEEYAYDDNGKLLSVTETDLHSDGKKDITTYTITWGVNNIIENRNGEAFTYTFKDGLITHRDYKNTFIYNSNKQLIESGNEDDYMFYTWQGENLAKTTYISKHNSNDEVIYEFTYSGKTCKGYFPIMIWYVVGDLCRLMEAHPELVGMRRNQLPDQIYHKDGSYKEIAKYTYTFDKDGYVESCTVVETDKDLSSGETYTDTTIYTFTWE